MLASDASDLGIVDELVSEPVGGAHRNPAEASQRLAARLSAHLGELEGMSAEARIDERYTKFRAMGRFRA